MTWRDAYIWLRVEYCVFSKDSRHGQSSARLVQFTSPVRTGSRLTPEVSRTPSIRRYMSHSKTLLSLVKKKRKNLVGVRIGSPLMERITINCWLLTIAIILKRKGAFPSTFLTNLYPMNRYLAISCGTKD